MGKSCDVSTSIPVGLTSQKKSSVNLNWNVLLSAMDNFKVPSTIPQDLLLIQDLVEPQYQAFSAATTTREQDDTSSIASTSEEEADEKEVLQDLLNPLSDQEEASAYVLTIYICLKT
jgi:hypothetical protein